jgi:hypothetical protein
MKTLLDDLFVVFIGIFVFSLLTRCSSMDKIRPEYKGVDPALQKYVNEYKDLAKIQGIFFDKEGTIGFKRLRGDTVGLTTYGIGWREIDIDSDYFNESSEVERTCLMFHELVHMYCDRGHTYNHGKPYPEYDTWRKRGIPKMGRYTDGSNCPLSIMFPSILDDYCMYLHYDDYVKEMFEDCKPW